MTKNYFAVLGLKPGASENDIKKSFRSLAKQWHPDKNKNQGAEEKFKEISAAYDFLQSKDRREILERDLTKPKETFKSETSYTKSSFNASHASTSSHTNSANSGNKSARSESSNNSKKKDTHWTSSFFGKKKKEKKPWSQEWDGTRQYEETKPKFFRRPPSFSDAFQSFVDQLDAEFETFFQEPSFDYKTDNSPFGFYDPFTPTSLFPPKQKKNKAPSQPRNVARETGETEGLDEEYLFSPRGYSGATSDDGDMSSDGEFGFNADEAAMRVKCHFCGKLIQMYKLARHEEECGKFSDSTSEDWNPYSESNRKNQKPSGDWRTTHAKLINNLRKAKQAARVKPEYVLCKWCGRSFSGEAAKRHVPFCERWTKQHGTPMNPSGPDKKPKQSKFERGKQYSQKVPKPGAKHDDKFVRPDFDVESDDEISASYPDSHSSSPSYNGPWPSYQPESAADKTKKGPVRSNVRKTPTKNSTQGQSTFFGVSGEGLKQKPGAGYHGNGGCYSCRKLYGSEARFRCSCGTKTSMA